MRRRRGSILTTVEVLPVGRNSNVAIPEAIVMINKKETGTLIEDSHCEKCRIKQMRRRRKKGKQEKFWERGGGRRERVKQRALMPIEHPNLQCPPCEMKDRCVQLVNILLSSLLPSFGASSAPLASV